MLEFKKEECLTQILIFRMGLKNKYEYIVYYSFEMVLSVRMRIWFAWVVNISSGACKEKPAPTSIKHNF